MKHYSLFVLAALLVLGGCANDTLTGVSGEGALLSDSPDVFVAKSETKMVPFEGYVWAHGWFNLSRTDCPTGSLPLDPDGNGEVDHLGAFEVYYEYCSFAQVDPTNPTFVGNATITAANGDQLLVTLSGSATGPITYAEDNTFTGGTGHFENVTGTFTNTGAFGPYPGGFSIDGVLEGVISSVGSLEVKRHGVLVCAKQAIGKLRLPHGVRRSLLLAA